MPSFGFDFSYSSKKTKALVIALESLFVSLTTGLVFGFGAFRSILLSEGVFEWVCDDIDSMGTDPVGGGGLVENAACKDQNFRYTIMFSIGSLALNCVVLPIGPLSKHFGPKLTSLISLATSFIGFILMAFSSQSFNAYYLGFALIGAGGGAFFVAQFHFANLFPGREGLICSCFSGCFNMSSAVFLVLWYIYDAGVPYVYVFSVYSLVPLLVLVVYTTFPSGFVPLQGDEEEPIMKIMDDQSEGIWLNKDEEEEEPSQDAKLQQYNQRNLSLSSQLLSFDLLLFSLSFAWSITCFNFYISEVGVMMDDVARRQGLDSDGSAYTLAFSWALPFSAIVTIPLSGFIMDFLGLFGAMFFMNFFALSSLILFFVPSLEVQPIAFFCVVEGITLSFALGPAFMNFFVGVANYSTIYGAVEFAAGIFSLFIVLFVYLSQHAFGGSYEAVILILLGVEVLTFASPLYFNYQNYIFQPSQGDEPQFLQAEDTKGNLHIQEN